MRPRITITIPADLLRRVDHAARRDDRSRSSQIVRCVRAVLEGDEATFDDEPTEQPRRAA